MNLSEPDVVNDPDTFPQADERTERSDSRSWKLIKNTNSASRILKILLRCWRKRSDEEMRELAKEELNDSKDRVAELEQELKILLASKGSER